MDKPHKITELSAWIVTQSDGTEALPALQTDLGPAPMVGSDSRRIEQLRPLALALAEAMRLPLKLVRFTNFVIVEEYNEWPTKNP